MATQQAPTLAPARQGFLPLSTLQNLAVEWLSQLCVLRDAYMKGVTEAQVLDDQ